MKDNTKVIKKIADEVLDAIYNLEGRLASHKSSIKLLLPTPYKNGWALGRRVRLTPGAIRGMKDPGPGTVINPLRDDAPDNVFVAFDGGTWAELPESMLINQ